MDIPDLTPLQWALVVGLLLSAAIAGIYHIGARLTPHQWALVVGLLLLAIAGIYHIGARLAGYKVLPMYQPRACGGPPHQLAYITEKERFDLIEADGEGVAKFGTQGVPCYTKRKRIDAFDEIDRRALAYAVDNDDIEHWERHSWGGEEQKRRKARAMGWNEAQADAWLEERVNAIIARVMENPQY